MKSKGVDMCERALNCIERIFLWEGSGHDGKKDLGTNNNNNNNIMTTY